MKPVEMGKWDEQVTSMGLQNSDTSAVARARKTFFWQLRPARKLQLAGIAFLLIFCIVGIAILSVNARRELIAMKALNVDNSQWVLMQTEVEVLRLQLAVEQAVDGGENGDLAELRKWFDIVFARISLLSQGERYAQQLRRPEFAPAAERLRYFLDKTTPLFDGPDDALHLSLQYLAELLPETHRAARELALQARSESAVASDLQRSSAKASLIQLAALVSLLFSALTGLALIALGLMQRSRVEMRQNSLTSARLQTIIATSADAIIVSNRGGWIVDFNPAAEAMFGYPRSKAIGVHALELLMPPEFRAAQTEEMEAMLGTAANKLEAQTPMQTEFMAMRADGTRFPVEMSLGSSRIASGGVVVALLRDISTRRSAELALTKALEQAQSGERAKSEFIAVMSHEMRTPLNGLLASLEILDSAALPPDQRELVQIAATSGQILLQNVNAVLDLSRAEADLIPEDPVAFDCDLLVRACVANQSGRAALKGLKLRLVAPCEPIGWVMGDPGGMQKILLNLIGNAVKFTASGSVTVEYDTLATGYPVEFRVIDSGRGIPEADLERVFEDFVTLDAGYDRQAEGTGLGLGIARRIARTMGGDIGAESVLGDGSLFWLRLPLIRAEPLPGQSSESETPVAVPEEIKGLNALVVEDNQVNRYVLRRLLEESGHFVTEAKDGQEGVTAALASQFDVILTDISMPGLDGIEVTRRIRNETGPSQSARIIAVTAHALPQDLDRFHEAGIDDCLTKPITRFSLSRALSGSADTSNSRPASPVLDIAQLSELAVRIGADRTADLLTRLIAECDAADGDENWSEGQDGNRRLHDMIGSAATFGARKLQKMLAELATAKSLDDALEARRLKVEVSALWQVTRAAMQDHVKTLTGGQSVG